MPASAAAQTAARRDRADKGRLEDLLRPRLREIGDAASRSLARSTLGIQIDRVAESTASALEPVLLQHYRSVAEAFADRLAARLPSDVTPVSAERERIRSRLERIFARRSANQASFIARTTEKDAKRAVRVAELERDRLVEKGAPAASVDVAMAAAANLSRVWRAREGGRVVFETQVPAEVAKQVEAEVLSGLDTGSTSIGVEPKARGRARAMKEWVSQADDLTRSWHLVADSKRVPVNEPFTVRGEKLMFPGDASLGASKDNLLNCRCSSVADPTPIVSYRRALLAAGALFGSQLRDEE